MLRVRVQSPVPGGEFQFDKPFRIGRAEDCDLRVQDEFVSRTHVLVSYDGANWLAKDNNSSNGIWVGGRRVPAASIVGTLEVRLGAEGPLLQFEVERPAPAHADTDIMKRYFGELSDGAPMSDRTMAIRSTFQQVQKKQKSRFGLIAGALAAAAIAIGAYAFYQHRQLSQRQAIAQDLFYSMKSLDVDIAKVEQLILDVNSPKGRDQIRQYQDRRKEMERNYDRFLTSLKVYDSKLSEKDRLIMRIARVLGECELAIPREFTTEIQNYIGKWQSTGRLEQAVARARQNGYDRRIARELLEHNLPPQFFYLALQESGFDPLAVGPETYMGHAKGMWQFIPDTATKYGLRLGPLWQLKRPDTRDERHDWEKATVAAVRYLHELYSTDALASGMLVMASYNWGEDKVIRLIRSMPANTRERNFWALLTRYRDKVPPETYNYVFSIVSAAVIGENPRLYGFKFDNPLGEAH